MSVISKLRRPVGAVEPAIGCEAVVNPADAVCLTHREFWFYDCCAADRSLAGSTAPTGRTQAPPPSGSACGRAVVR
ncbi:hypothetical protein F6R97_28650 [Pseudomonas sp. JV414]|nr:hypothetical protein [Pseudomonas sp. JV414]